MQAQAQETGMLADRHTARGGQCQACHIEMPPKAIKGTQCQACHGGYEQMAKRTDKLDINPHDSHIEDIDCTNCHKGHKKPVLVCDECHEFTQLKIR